MEQQELQGQGRTPGEEEAGTFPDDSMALVSDAAEEGAEEETDAGEDSDASSEDDLHEFGIRQCLPVPDGEPDWEAGEPETVEEYLRRVRYEARQLPDVVTASALDPAALLPQQLDDSQQQRQPRRGGGTLAGLPAASSDADVPACPPDMRPSVAWLRAFLQQFAALRRTLQQEQEALLLLGDQGGYSAVSLAAAQAGVAALSLQEESASPSATMPELKALRGLDQTAVLVRLQAAVQRLEERQQQQQDKASALLSPADAALLYALSARVERPLSADTAALFRSLLRRCAATRAALPGGLQDPLLPHLNVLAAIAGAYFGQDEELAGLWEEED